MGTKEKCAAGLLLIGDLCPLPADAAGDVGDLHALGLQLIADTVGLGEVFGLLGVGPGPDQGTLMTANIKPLALSWMKALKTRFNILHPVGEIHVCEAQTF